ncbi:winged helix-turn-helix domain-containing protein [Paenibacillus bovis]|uniref:HTH merR-type domain-containing protein n=1 Tax=Paenibacillus bovis TaxID=1616788 RepID=A0A1X9T4B1_9BACL|nr:hypothetical protein [Paenibacillus bovis]ARR10734.1 hypothetical protein AR543_p0126 [Paenibacillus bovis]
MSNPLTNKIVADRLDISSSTLKRWIALMEEAGYVFYSPGSVRKLLEKDLTVFKKVKMYSGKPNCTLEQAVIKAVDWFHKQNENQEASAQAHPEDTEKQRRAEQTTAAPTGSAAPASLTPAVQAAALSVDQAAIMKYDHIMMNLLPGMFWKGKETQQLLQEEWSHLRGLLLGSSTSQPDLNLASAGGE